VFVQRAQSASYCLLPLTLPPLLLLPSFFRPPGAKALTMKQAILIASVCEFGGAVLLGSGVTDTIRGKIADLDYYVDKPDLYM
jgi:sodium-dependent phosphate transporter